MQKIEMVEFRFYLSQINPQISFIVFLPSHLKSHLKKVRREICFDQRILWSKMVAKLNFWPKKIILIKNRNIDFKKSVRKAKL